MSGESMLMGDDIQLNRSLECVEEKHDLDELKHPDGAPSHTSMGSGGNRTGSSTEPVPATAATNWAELHPDVIRLIFRCFGDTESWFCLSTVCRYVSLVSHRSGFISGGNISFLVSIRSEQLFRDGCSCMRRSDHRLIPPSTLICSPLFPSLSLFSAWRKALDHPTVYELLCKSLGWKPMVGEKFLRKLQIARLLTQDLTLTTIPLTPPNAGQSADLERSASVVYEPQPVVAFDWSTGCTHYINTGHFVVATHAPTNEIITMSAAKLANIGARTIPYIASSAGTGTPAALPASVGTWSPQARVVSVAGQQSAQANTEIPTGVWFPYEKSPLLQFALLGSVARPRLFPKDRAFARRSFQWSHMEDHSDEGPLRNIPTEHRGIPCIPVDVTSSTSFNAQHFLMLEQARKWVAENPDPFESHLGSPSPSMLTRDYVESVAAKELITEADLPLYQISPLDPEVHGNWTICGIADTSFYRKHLLGIPTTEDIKRAKLASKGIVTNPDARGESTSSTSPETTDWRSTPYHCDPNRPGFFCSALVSDYPLSAAQTLCSPFRRHRLGFAPPEATEPPNVARRIITEAAATGGGGAAGNMASTLAASFVNPPRPPFGRHGWSTIALGDACALFVAGGMRGANLYFTNFHSPQGLAVSPGAEKQSTITRSLREAFGFSKTPSNDPENVDEPPLDDPDPTNGYPISSDTSVHPWVTNPVLTATSFGVRPVTGLARPSLLEGGSATAEVGEDVAARTTTGAPAAAAVSAGAAGGSPTAVYGTAAPYFFSGRHRVPADKTKIRRPPKTYCFTPVHISAITCVTLCELARPLTFPWIQPGSSRTAYAAAAAFMTGRNLTPGTGTVTTSGSGGVATSSGGPSGPKLTLDALQRSDALPVGYSPSKDCLTVRRLAASAGYDGVVAIWDPDTGTLIQLAYVQARIWSLVIHESGRFVAVGANDDRVHVLYIDGLPDAIYVPRETVPFEPRRQSYCTPHTSRAELGRAAPSGGREVRPVISLYEQEINAPTVPTPEMKEKAWRTTATILAEGYCPPLGYSMHTVAVTPKDPHSDTALSLAFPSAAGEPSPGSLTLVVGSREVSVWDLTPAIRAFAKRRWIEFGIRIPEDFGVELHDEIEATRLIPPSTIPPTHRVSVNPRSSGAISASLHHEYPFLFDNEETQLSHPHADEQSSALRMSIERVRRELLGTHTKFAVAYTEFKKIIRVHPPEPTPLCSVVFEAQNGIKALCGFYSEKKYREWTEKLQDLKLQHEREYREAVVQATAEGRPTPPMPPLPPPPQPPSEFKSTIHTLDATLMPHFVLLGTRHGDVVVWDVEEDKLFRRLDPLLRGDITSIKLLRHGDIVCAGTMPTVQVYRFQEPSFSPTAIGDRSSGQGGGNDTQPTNAGEVASPRSTSTPVGILRDFFKF